MVEEVETDTYYQHERFGEVYVSEFQEDLGRTQVLFDDGGCYRIDWLDHFKERVKCVEEQ